MTGEITLRGRILPIGGLKEKTMAAMRIGITTVIIPRENEKDLEEIDPTVRSALKFVTTDHVDKILDVAFGRRFAAAVKAAHKRCARRRGEREPAPVRRLPWRH